MSFFTFVVRISSNPINKLLEIQIRFKQHYAGPFDRTNKWKGHAYDQKLIGLNPTKL
jgi:hypothetical protein